MQSEVDILKNMVEESSIQRYPQTNTEGLSDTSPQWVVIRKRMESIELENQQLKGESQQSQDENRKTWNQLDGAFTKVQCASTLPRWGGIFP